MQVASMAEEGLELGQVVAVVVAAVVAAAVAWRRKEWSSARCW